LPNVTIPGSLGSVRGSVCLGFATTSLLVISGATARAQALAPSSLDLTSHDQKTGNAIVQAITSKSVQAVTKKREPASRQRPAQQLTKGPVQTVTKEPIQTKTKQPALAFASEPVRPIEKPITSKTTWSSPHFSFKTPEGKSESVPVISRYYPKQIVYPFGKVDRHIDGRLMQAATIAEERAHAHSRSMCWHYVKEALLASGVIDSRPKSELARDAAQELVNNYGFKRLSVTDPFAAPVGSVLVYGTARTVGHVELRTQGGFVSDFRSKTPSRRPLLGVYAKL
jgi:hypothetical protein